MINTNLDFDLRMSSSDENGKISQPVTCICFINFLLIAKIFVKKFVMYFLDF